MTVMPNEIAQYGYVVARAVRIIGDQDDLDDFPDAIGATGSITFTPVAKNKRTSDYSTFVIFESVSGTLNEEGVLVGPSGFPGVWLVTGLYDVTFDVPGGAWGNIQIEVTTNHTQANPLDLVQAVPYVPDPAVSVVMMAIPGGGQPGQILTPTAPGSNILEWTTSTDVGVTAHGELTGLDGDDHPQYLTAARGDLRYAPQGDYVETTDPRLYHDHSVYIKSVGGTGPDQAGNVEVPWDSVSEKPTTFPPSTHQHVAADITDLQTIEGEPGDSAYQIAVSQGFVGTEAEWLESLKGPKGDPGADSTVPGPKGDPGADSTVPGPKGDKGDPGDDAYQVAVSQGFVGTEAEWLESLKGPKGDPGADSTVPGPKGDPGADSTVPGPKGDKGDPGDSAYEVAVSQGFVGTEAEWLESLKGDPGADSTVPGPKGDPGADSTVPGPKGDPGDSAYQIAVAQGFVGTEAEWLESLKGEPGNPGGGGGGSAAKEVRSAVAGDYSYMGTAPLDTLESAASWKISRIALTGTVGSVTTATGAAWDNRESEVYS